MGPKSLFRQPEAGRVYVIPGRPSWAWPTTTLGALVGAAVAVGDDAAGGAVRRRGTRWPATCRGRRGPAARCGGRHEGQGAEQFQGAHHQGLLDRPDVGLWFGGSGAGWTLDSGTSRCGSEPPTVSRTRGVHGHHGVLTWMESTMGWAASTARWNVDSGATTAMASHCMPDVAGTSNR